jgi:membrane fusion protein, adhesin transport system
VSVKARREQAAQSFTLTAKELELTRPLVKTGAVSDVELLRLERDVARYRGERDSASSDIPRIESSIAEANRKIQEVELTFRNIARSELSETNAKLSALSEGSTALVDRVKQTDIRSPVNGTVKQLRVNTVGGVVQPGKDLIEIVPSDDALLLEARVQPRDIAFLRPGQKALVKFTAYDFSTYGGLEATLEHISADTVVDEKGNAFFLVRVRTASTDLGPTRLPIIPGMVAEVDILTGKKTVLHYLMKPILRAKSSALTER